MGFCILATDVGSFILGILFTVLAALAVNRDGLL